MICSETESDPFEEKKKDHIHGKQMVLFSVWNALPTPAHPLGPGPDVSAPGKPPPAAPPKPQQNSRPHFLPSQSTLECG